MKNQAAPRLNTQAFHNAECTPGAPSIKIANTTKVREPTMSKRLPQMPSIVKNSPKIMISRKIRIGKSLSNPATNEIEKQKNRASINEFRLLWNGPGISVSAKKIVPKGNKKNCLRTHKYAKIILGITTASAILTPEQMY